MGIESVVKLIVSGAGRVIVGRFCATSGIARSRNCTSTLYEAARCGAKAYPAVKTDKGGTYNLVVAETGKCTLTITHQGKSATVDVASYDDAAQADIALELKDGQLSARRR